MKKQIIAVSALLFTLVFSVQQIVSNPTGAPQQASGGPAEGGATCSQSGCHSGTPTTVSNIITTDIPAEGYTPGTTYNLTVTVTGSGWKGFMISPQNPSGTFLGTFSSGTGSKVVFTNYITHSSDKSSSPAIWTFKWKAPVAGSGPVTFYGAFAVTQNATRKQQLVVNENTTTAVNTIDDVLRLKMYPNPITDRLILTYTLPSSGAVSVELMSVDGKNSYKLFEGTRVSGEQEQGFDVSDVQSGLYLLKVNTENGEHLRKVLVQ